MCIKYVYQKHMEDSNVHVFLFSVLKVKQTTVPFFSRRRSLRDFRMLFHTAGAVWGHIVQYVFACCSCSSVQLISDIILNSVRQNNHFITQDIYIGYMLRL